MSPMLRLTGALALALLGSVGTALPHPDSPLAPEVTTLLATVTATEVDATTITITSPPSSSSLTTTDGVLPYTGSCDGGPVCVSGTKYCHYWAGITGWDSNHNPVPGETVASIGTCGPDPATTAAASTATPAA
ncbi:hypothetical protein GGR53DRAFT_277325 [Hypoxylon sp. FL1150]|nr:hypothetical protein GGR53DRAFT_277325 [Hypoxylon sp. FL1150]